MKAVLLAELVIVSATPASFGQTCLHGASESPGNRQRREQALQLAQRINMAQAVIVGPSRLMKK